MMALRTHFDGSPMPQNCRCTLTPVTADPDDDELVRNLQLAMIRARIPHPGFDDDNNLLCIHGWHTRPEAEAIYAMVKAATARQAAPRTFTPTEQPASHVWRMTGTELNAELAKEWDEGWDADLSGRFHANPYRR